MCGCWLVLCWNSCLVCFGFVLVFVCRFFVCYLVLFIGFVLGLGWWLGVFVLIVCWLVVDECFGWYWNWCGCSVRFFFIIVFRCCCCCFRWYCWYCFCFFWRLVWVVVIGWFVCVMLLVVWIVWYGLVLVMYVGFWGWLLVWCGWYRCWDCFVCVGCYWCFVLVWWCCLCFVRWIGVGWLGVVGVWFWLVVIVGGFGWGFFLVVCWDVVGCFVVLL